MSGVRHNAKRCRSNNREATEPAVSQAAPKSDAGTEGLHGRDGPLTMVLHDTHIHSSPWHIPLELVDACLTGDVLLVCKDNKAVQCHSVILALSSDVLRGMFESTEVCKSATVAKPAHVHMPGDEAEHWLYVLLHLYPNLCPPAPPDVHTAVALATLGHKYNMKRALIAWESFARDVCELDPNTGHFKWVINKWSECRTKFLSHEFKAGGINGKALLRAGGDLPAWQLLTHVRLGVCVTPVNGRLTVKAMIVDQAQPWNSHVECSKEHDEGLIAWNQFMELSEFNDPQKGFVQDDTVEVQMLVQVDESLETGEGPVLPVLSGVPGHPMYVFKWLDVAKRVQHAELERKCLAFLTANTFHTLFEKQFRRDLLSAMVDMGPDMYMKLMRMGMRL